MFRRSWIGLTLALAGLVAPVAVASEGVQILRVETGSYPLIRALVLLPPGLSVPPRLSVQGAAAGSVSAESLAGKESVVLVIDHSQSMRGLALGDAIGAARTFVAASPGTDQIGVIAVASRATPLANVTSADGSVAPALQNLTLDPRDGTALWDSIMLAAESLRKHGLAGRVIVLLSDGRNSTSKHTLQDAIRAARAARATVYTVGIPNKVTVNGRAVTLGYRWYTPGPLEHLAAATGGRFYPAPSTAALPGIYRTISAELRRTWQLSFYTAARPGDALILHVRAGQDQATTHLHLAADLKHTSPAGISRYLITIAALLAAVALACIALILRSTTFHHRWSRQTDF